MKVKSKIDVITNSSSEVYLIRYPDKPEKLKEKLVDKRKSMDLWCSGMGGIIEVHQNEPNLDDWGFGILDGYVVVQIDQGFTELIDYLKNNYEVLQNLDTEDGPREDMIREAVKKKIKDLEEQAYQETPSRQVELWQEIENLKEMYEIKD